MKCYLSGPMSGLPDLNYPAFNEAAAELRAKGHEVINPAENPEQDSWEAYMRLDLVQLLGCEVVVQLPGYWGSRGAMLEFAVASTVGIEVVDLSAFLEATFCHTCKARVLEYYFCCGFHYCETHKPAVFDEHHFDDADTGEESECYWSVAE